MWKLGEEGEICDGVCVQIEIAHLLEPQHHWEQSLYFLLGDRQARVCHRAVVGSLAQTAQPSLKDLLQLLQILLSLYPRLLLSFLALLFLESLFLLALLQLLLELLGSFLDRSHWFLLHYAVVFIIICIIQSKTP